MKRCVQAFVFSALMGISYPVMAQSTESGTTTTTTRTENDNDDSGKWGLLGLAGLLGLIPRKKKETTVVRTTGTTHNH